MSTWEIMNPICTSLLKFSRQVLSSDDSEWNSGHSKWNMDKVRADFAKNGRECDENDDKNIAIRKPRKIKSILKNSMLENSVKNSFKSPKKHCVFCDNNRRPAAIVNSHSLRDLNGDVTCPFLQALVCPKCGKSGAEAHTIRYCPDMPIITMEATIEAEECLSNFLRFKQGLKSMH